MSVLRGTYPEFLEAAVECARVNNDPSLRIATWIRDTSIQISSSTSVWTTSAIAIAAMIALTIKRAHQEREEKRWGIFEGFDARFRDIFANNGEVEGNPFRARLDGVSGCAAKLRRYKAVLGQQQLKTQTMVAAYNQARKVLNGVDATLEDIEARGIEVARRPRPPPGNEVLVRQRLVERVKDIDRQLRRLESIHADVIDSLHSAFYCVTGNDLPITNSKDFAPDEDCGDIEDPTDRVELRTRRAKSPVNRIPKPVRRQEMNRERGTGSIVDETIDLWLRSLHQRQFSSCM